MSSGRTNGLATTVTAMVALAGCTNAPIATDGAARDRDASESQLGDVRETGDAGEMVDRHRNDALPENDANSEPTSVAPFSACKLSFPYQDEPGRGRWLGGDSAYSVLLDSKTALWSFQDTFVGKVGQGARAGSTLIANSFALVTCEGSVQSIRYFWGLSNGAPRAILSDGVTNQRLWPQQPFLYNGALFLAMTRVQGGADEIGTTLARVANPTDPPDQWTAQYFDLTTLPGLGKGTVLVDGYAYLFGNLGTAIAARLPLDALAAPGAAPKALLQYLAKDGTWKAGLVATDAKQLGFAANVGTSFRQLQTSGRWMVLFLTTGGWPSADIAISTAPTLEGPWTAARNVFKVPEMIPGRAEYDADTVCYAAIEHPESNADPAQNLFFSYTCNSTVFAKQLANLGIYLPRLVTVAIPPS